MDSENTYVVLFGIVEDLADVCAGNDASLLRSVSEQTLRALRYAYGDNIEETHYFEE